MKWPIRTLADVCESVRYGYTASATSDEVGPHFLRITDIVPDSIEWAKVPFCEISERHAARFSLQAGDIVVARTGATVGYAKLIREEVNAVFASYLVRFRVEPTVASPGFVGRLVESPAYKNFVKSRVGGAAQPNANAQVLGAFSFRFPPRREQDRITDILSFYDNFIENNRRRIQLLEQEARMLYKEWFVRLLFPGHEHVKVVDGVPEGWDRKRLGDVAPLQYGKALKEGDRVPGPCPVYGSSGIVGAHEKALVRGPGIIVGRKGNVGSVYWSERDFCPIDTVYYVDSTESSLYLYYALQQVNFISTDVAVPGLNRNFAHSKEILVANDTLRSAFEEAAVPIHRQMSGLRKLSETAVRARDLLLPRLINGTITV